VPRPEIRFSLREAYARYPDFFPRNANGTICRLSDDGSEVVVEGRADITNFEVALIRQALHLVHPRLPLNRLPRRRNADRRLRPIT